jgi:hypothetical protein
MSLDGSPRNPRGQVCGGRVVARLRVEASVMLLDSETTEETGVRGTQGDLQVIPIDR